MSSGPTVAPPSTAPGYETSRASFNIDVSKTFREHNKEMCENYGKDTQTSNFEKDAHFTDYYLRNEAALAHGYPLTLYLQGGIFYLTAYYTARGQGLPNPHLFYKSHWFDWITCFKRFAVFGIAGGMILGTVMFGDTGISLKRIYNRYNRLTYTDPRFSNSGNAIPAINR